MQLVDTQRQPVPLAAVHLDGPRPQDATADEHGFVTFWGLVAGDYTVQATTRLGIPTPPTTLAYPTAKTTVGARTLRSSKTRGGSSVSPNNDDRTTPTAGASGPPSQGET